MAVETGEPGITLQQRPIRDAARLRSRSPLTGGGDIEQAGVHLAERVGAEAEAVHNTGREVFDQDVGLGGEVAGDVDRRRVFQVQDDAPLGLAQRRVEFRRSARIAAAGCFDLDHIRPHRCEVAGRRRPGDNPAEIEHPDARQRQRAIVPGRLIIRGRFTERDAIGVVRHFHAIVVEVGLAEERPMGELYGIQLFQRLAERKARHMGGLGGIRDPLLVVAVAPFGHQAMQVVPIRDPVGLGLEAGFVAPIGAAHDLQPGGPLMVLAGRDRRIAVRRGKNADRRAIAVGLPLPHPAGPAAPGAGQLRHRERRQRFLYGDVDDAAALRQQSRMHAGRSSREPADEGRLRAHGPDRGLR